MDNEKTKQKPDYTISDALNEFEELKKMALNSFDKNGNPNISIALKAIENKAKVAGLYKINKQETKAFTKMGNITIDGEQLKLNIGEDF